MYPEIVDIGQMFFVLTRWMWILPPLGLQFVRFPEVEERAASHSRSVKLGLCNLSEESHFSKRTRIPVRVSWSGTP